MRKIILMCIIFSFVGMLRGFCSEIALIDQQPEHIQENLTEQDQEQQEEYEQEDDEELASDEFEKMNEYIDLENQKIKDIKLLSLDLQKADLQLKKREIEQKIDQMSKGNMVSLMKESADNTTDVLRIPSLKLMSVFLNDTHKKALVSIDGVQKFVVEGQELDSMKIKTIAREGVIIQWVNGQTQELVFS